MIPRPYITEWAAAARWINPTDAEQDMILTRLIIEIANDPLLGEELAFRGGTCLQKFHLPEPLRYSEDLDYVRTGDDPKLGEIFGAIRVIADQIGLSERRRRFPGKNSDLGTIWFDAQPEAGSGRIRIKIESNVAETTPYGDYLMHPFEMESRWWLGRASVRTFNLDEMLGTKLRALYERRKGRDLFDLWAVLTQLEVADAEVVATLGHYQERRGRQTFTYPQLRQNLLGKLSNAAFLDDLAPLVVVPPELYDPPRAADLVLSRLGVLLRNAPEAHEPISP